MDGEELSTKPMLAAFWTALSRVTKIHKRQ
jgi:hypothetical protein